MQVTRLQAFLTVIVCFIAVVPSSIFFVLELDHLRAHGREHARHFALVIAVQAKASAPDRDRIAALLSNEAGRNGIAAFALVDGQDREIIRVGAPRATWAEVEGAAAVNPPVGPAQKLYVFMDGGPLLYRAARVIAIHLTVAALLAFVIARAGIRPLHRAIDEVQAIRNQLIHSEKLSAIGEIYAGLTHEINNPLGIILSKVELMRADAKDRHFSPELMKDLEMIHRHSARIAEIIRGLLAFARRTSFDLKEVNLNRVIDETLALFEGSLSRPHIRIEREMDRSLPAIVGSPVHLQQVFLNLLNNARDAMPQGGTITLRTYRNQRRVVAEVLDTGSGIAEALRDRIFEPFFTTKGVGKGTGLGLSVSYGIIGSHGGDLQVESSVGKGALFRLMLPIEQSRA